MAVTVETKAYLAAVALKKILVIGLLVAACGFSTPASADSLSLQGLGKGQSVSLTMGSVTESGWAGEINWLLTTSGGTEQIYTYCVDLFSPALNTQNPVTVETTNELTPTTSVNSIDGAGARAAWLFNTYAAGIHALPDSLDSYAQAAGLQIAIWQAMYETVGNTFTVTASDSAKTYASNYLGALGSNTSVATYLDSGPRNGQDQITRVPEPSSVLLLLLALPLLVAFDRRGPSPLVQR